MDNDGNIRILYHRKHNNIHSILPWNNHNPWNCWNRLFLHQDYYQDPAEQGRQDLTERKGLYFLL